MTAARLMVPLELEAMVRTPDDMGGYRQDWNVLGRVWAEMRSGSGGEKAGLGPESVVSWRITVRAARSGDPRRPRPDQRFVMGEGKTKRCFRIVAVAESDPKQRYLVCFAKEEVAA
ncbi:head-tail adaptor protein [Paracoccus aestuariivivens]|uniref:Head-tail adaptor protein n=1 Tax=Paracoccus aestuariivivens TaxID=1820333 RepID=A0A6L6J522_9RHOB|nr:head-tail adaptor protein [Paracoccus aestuariivivens]MTH77203.1 head-tail adaptor protein [Paracoccus aestuariivivens]